MAADTKEKILNTAELLFAEHGITNTSVRAITHEARVNLASVNYHFGSKDELVAQVFVRRLEPMNRERLSRLGELKRHAGGVRLCLNEVTRAFIEPPLELSRRDDGGAVFTKLLGRTYTEPTIHGLIRTTHRAVIDSFRPVFQECLPELPAEILYWRLHFMVGVLAYTMAGSDTMRLISSGNIGELPGAPELARQLSDFIVAGLQAPIQ